MTIRSSFSNHFLIATPMVNEPSLAHSVIYVCEHEAQGAVGLMINHPMPFSMGLVFNQLQIEPINIATNSLPLLFGGPTQPERGFVIHRPFGDWHSSLALRDDVTVTTSNDIIRAIAQDNGPTDVLVTLGYAGWSESQLEKEVMNDRWLVCPYNPELLYDVPFDKRWEYAGSIMGVKMNQLTTSSGHA